jgi:hypothetical protein
MRRVADPPGTPVRGFRFGRVAAFKSEAWPASFRNGGRHQIGMPGRNASEFAAYCRNHFSFASDDPAFGTRRRQISNRQWAAVRPNYVFGP